MPGQGRVVTTRRRHPALSRSGGLRADEEETRLRLCEFLSLFYDKGWVTGTGGGICAGVGQDRFLMAPTGVHKERVVPDDLFVVEGESGAVVHPPKNRVLRVSECGGIFRAIIRGRGAGSVMHSHGLPAVLAADLAHMSDRVVLRDLEMLKGIRGGVNTEPHAVPVIHNTAYESELLEQINATVTRAEFRHSYCVLVRDHGAYIWGEDLWETKRHAEAYHFLFEATVARARRQ